MKRIITIILTATTLCLTFTYTALSVSVKPVDLLLADEFMSQCSDRPLNYRLKPGESMRGFALVRNKSSKPVSVKIYGADGMNAQNGGVTLAQEGKMIGLGSWLKLDASLINLSPWGERWVSYTMKVPESVEIGEHTGGILIQKVIPVKKRSGNLIINEVQRAAIFITERVVGKVKEIIKIIGFRNKLAGGKEIFRFIVKNEGNVRTYADCKIKIRNVITRKKAGTIKFERGLILPRSISPYAAIWNATPEYGYFSALLQVAYGKGKITTKEIKFFIVPWVIVLIALIVLLVLTIGIIIWFRRKKISARTSNNF